MNTLAGHLQLRPGAPLPQSLRSTRRAWAEQVSVGQPASALPGLLVGLFSLCAHAHRAVSQLALHAAGQARSPDAATIAAVEATLARETALEHVRRLSLDWPLRLAGADTPQDLVAQARATLHGCPLIGASPSALPWAALRQWLQDHWLGMPALRWWADWQAGGIGWLTAWSRRQGGWLPRLLHHARAADTPLPQLASAALRPHAHEADLLALGQALATQTGFALQPLWNGQVASTGPWARLQPATAVTVGTAWGLLGSRLAELVRLCLSDLPEAAGRAVLQAGALPTGPRRGLAWVETARGLLIHQVALAPPVAGAPTRVLACQVLAPTEWNFHPRGVVAQSLSALPPEAPDLPARVGLLIAAFDPCVDYELLPGGPGQAARQVTHA